MNLPKTIQCSCGSHRLWWVKTTAPVVGPRVAHYECLGCGGTVKVKLTEKCGICGKRECIHLGKENKK